MFKLNNVSENECKPWGLQRECFSVNACTINCEINCVVGVYSQISDNSHLKQVSTQSFILCKHVIRASSDLL